MKERKALSFFVLHFPEWKTSNIQIFSFQRDDASVWTWTHLEEDFLWNWLWSCGADWGQTRKLNSPLQSTCKLSKYQALDTLLLIVLISFGSDISGACKELTDFTSDCYSRYQSSSPPWANNREWHEARIKLVYTSSIFVTLEFQQLSDLADTQLWVSQLQANWKGAKLACGRGGSQVLPLTEGQNSISITWPKDIVNRSLFKLPNSILIWHLLFIYACVHFQ